MEKGTSCSIHGIDFSPLKGKTWSAKTAQYVILRYIYVRPVPPVFDLK